MLLISQKLLAVYNDTYHLELTFWWVEARPLWDVKVWLNVIGALQAADP